MDYHLKAKLASTIGALTGLLVLIGSAGPWAKVWFITVSGLDGDGIFTACLALIAGGLLVYRAAKASSSRWPAIISLIVFGICLMVGLIDLSNIQDVIGQEDAESSLITVQVGWGLYLVILSSILGMIASAVASFGHRTATHHQEPILGMSVEN